MLGDFFYTVCVGLLRNHLKHVMLVYERYDSRSIPLLWFIIAYEYDFYYTWHIINFTDLLIIIYITPSSITLPLIGYQKFHIRLQAFLRNSNKQNQTQGVAKPTSSFGPHTASHRRYAEV